MSEPNESQINHDVNDQNNLPVITIEISSDSDSDSEVIVVSAPEIWPQPQPQRRVEFSTPSPPRVQLSALPTPLPTPLPQPEPPQTIDYRRLYLRERRPPPPKKEEEDFATYIFFSDVYAKETKLSPNIIHAMDVKATAEVEVRAYRRYSAPLKKKADLLRVHKEQVVSGRIFKANFLEEAEFDKESHEVDTEERGSLETAQNMADGRLIPTSNPVKPTSSSTIVSL